MRSLFSGLISKKDRPTAPQLTQEICDGLQDEVKQRCQRKPHPLRAFAFIIPEEHEKGSEKIGAVMRSLASPHVQFFDVWSEPEHVELVAVGADNVVTHLAEQFRRIFRAKPTTDLVSPPGEFIPIPPWLRSGLYYKVLNVRAENPFASLGEFSENDDPLAAFISTLHALGKDGVRVWAAFGWTEFDWQPWEREYAKSASLDIYSTIQSEAYQGPFYPEDTAKPTTGYRQSTTQAEKRAQTTRLIAAFRIAVFAEHPAIVEHAVRTIQGAVRAFAVEGSVLHADPAPFEVTHRLEVNDLEALLMMADRELGREGNFSQLLQRHVEENVVRGRVGPLATPFPYLLINPDELTLFVHLPVWATERQLTSLRYQKPPTAFIRIPTKPSQEVPWIVVGSAVEADTHEIPLGINEFMTHSLYLGKSLDHNEPIIYESSGSVKIACIGELVDRFYAQSHMVQGQVPVTGIRVPSLNPETLRVEWKPVRYVLRHRYTGRLLRFKLQTGRSVTVTPDHSVFTVVNGQVVHVPADELEVGDIVLAPSRIPPHNPTDAPSIDIADVLTKSCPTELRTFYIHNVPKAVYQKLPEVVREHKRFRNWRRSMILPFTYAGHLTEDEMLQVTISARKGVEPPAKLGVDTDLARFLGYFVAEGNVNITGNRNGKAGYAVCFTLGPRDDMMIQDILRILRRKLGEPQYHIRPHGEKGCRLIIYDKVLAYTILHLVGTGARGKRVPEVILNGASDVRRQFLRAWIEGDAGATVSRQLASDIEYLLLLDGNISTFYEGKAGTTHRSVKIGRMLTSRGYFHLKFPRPTEIVTGAWRALRAHEEPSFVPIKVAPNPLRSTFKAAWGLGTRITPRTLGKLASWRERLTRTDRPLGYEACRKDARYRIALGSKHLLMKSADGVALTHLGEQIVAEIDVLTRLAHGDLAFLEIKEKKWVDPTSAYVYDLSVPEHENFVGGFGGVICHNTGSGKSTSIVNNLLQIVQASRSAPPPTRSTFWVIDPLGALGDAWKRCAPQEVLEQTYFFDPEKTPWGMNMLELPPYHDDKERAMMVAVKIEAVTRMIKEAAKMISGQQQWGHRLETIIRQTMLALYSRPTIGQTPEPRDVPTFSELFKVVAAISDEEALGQVAAEMQLPPNIVTLFKDYDTQAKSAVYNKLLYFVEPHIESFTCSTKNNINFRELDKPGNIVFFDFKHYAIMPTTVATLMANVIVNIYLAELYSKTRLERSDAWQTYLVIDEFHRAADLASFHDILSTARNIKLSLWLAYQGIEQLTDEALSQTVFNNTHIKFVFSVGGDIAKHVKDQLDIALGKQIAERLQTLEMHQCYLSRTGTALVQTPPPILIRTPPPPKPLRSMEEADAFLAKKMAGFKPPVIERSFNLGPAAPSSTPQTEAEAAFEAFRRSDGALQLPEPEDYPVLWALRDFFFRGLETRARAANVTDEFPDFDELTQFINQQAWVVGNAKYRQRNFLFEAVTRLKKDGWIHEGSIGSMGKRAFVLTNNPLHQAIVLFNIPSSGAPNLGSQEHLEITRGFMAETTRKYMPNFMPYMPLEASDLPDGILIPANGHSWNLKTPVAVECHLLYRTKHWERPSEQCKKRFKQGYSGIIIVCKTRQDEQTVRKQIAKDPELKPRLDNSDIEIYVFNPENRG